MIQGLVLSSHSKKVPELNPSWGLSAWSLHFLPVPVRASSYSPNTCTSIGHGGEVSRQSPLGV